MNSTVARFSQREWMGIEPTQRLFSRYNGFEARGGHQIRVHSRNLNSQSIHSAVAIQPT